MSEHASPTLKTYWTTWSILLGLTLVMLVFDQMSMPRLLFVLLMLTAMLVKATMIAGIFMHLRFERVAFVLMIFVGLFVNGAILYGLIVPDAARIFEMTPWPGR